MRRKPVAVSSAYVIAEDPTRKLIATVILCLGSLATALTMPATADEMATYRYGAYAMAVVLAAALGVEASGGARALNRADIVALIGIYFLTFAEFLHPHVRVLHPEPTGKAALSCNLVLIGIACLAIGRHFPMPFSMGVGGTRLPELRPRQLFWLFIVLFVLSFLWVFIAVRFNPFELAHSMVAERFARPWQRGRLGGWSSFLTELMLLAYPMGGLAGVIFGNARRYGSAQKWIVSILLAFTMLFFIGEGARNRVMILSGIFLSAYFVSNREAKSWRIIAIAIAAAALLWIVSGFMLDFRNMGLGAYLAGKTVAIDDRGDFMLDNNLVSMARVAQMFPSYYSFPGWDVVLQIFTKWVPRALWPDKPIDWTNSIDAALGTGGAYTIAVTYVGEAYLIAGIPTVIAVSLILGSLCATWTKVGLAARTNLELIYYATGFFAVMLGMRSVQFISIAIVPLVAFYLLSRWLGSGRAHSRGPGTRRFART